MLAAGVIELMDLIRAWHGPMSASFCNFLQVVRHTIQITAFFLWLIVALLKYWFVCIRKSMPTIDDNFVTTFTTRAAFMLSFLYSLVGIILPQKPTLAHVS